MTKRVLGRGLDALLSANSEEPEVVSDRALNEVPVERVIPNDAQPRRRFDPDKIASLALSIEEKGILQPIVVRPQGDRFQIIAGERRFLAAKQAGLRQVPVVIREVPDEEMLQWALIENLQRADLDPVEEAEAFRLLIEEQGLTHDQLSAVVGRDRSSITNSIRLLRLAERMLRAVADGKLSAGHGRALLQAPEGAVRDRLFERVLRDRLSVRRTEELARGGVKPGKRRLKPADPAKRDPQLALFEDRLRERLGTRVQIKEKAKGGVIEIEYYGNEEFERLYAEIILGEEGEASDAAF